jgi:hypothetical protein
MEPMVMDRRTEPAIAIAAIDWNNPKQPFPQCCKNSDIMFLYVFRELIPGGSPGYVFAGRNCTCQPIELPWDWERLGHPPLIINHYIL